MSHRRWCCVAGLLAAALCAVAGAALAETCTLELKRMGATPSEARPPWFFTTSAQSVSTQFGDKIPRQADAEKEFRGLVKKEPEKYVSKEPFRGVIKLGTGKFAFVLDSQGRKVQGL